MERRLGRALRPNEQLSLQLSTHWITHSLFDRTADRGACLSEFVFYICVSNLSLSLDALALRVRVGVRL